MGLASQYTCCVTIIHFQVKRKILFVYYTIPILFYLTHVLIEFFIRCPQNTFFIININIFPFCFVMGFFTSTFLRMNNKNLKSNLHQNLILLYEKNVLIKLNINSLKFLIKIIKTFLIKNHDKKNNIRKESQKVTFFDTSTSIW